MSLATRYDDPILETIARSIFALFPRCLRCGEPIARFDEADVRILTHRVVHRGVCPPPASPSAGEENRGPSSTA